MPVLTGSTKTSTGAPLGTATVKVMNSATDALVATGTSDGTGAFSIATPGTGPYYATAHKVVNGVFHTGITARDLVATGVPSISILSHGATTGSTNNTAAIQAAIDAAKVAGTSVFVPAGTFKYTSMLELDGVIIEGGGVTSVLQGMTTTDQTLRLLGSGAGVRNLKIQCAGGPRLSAYESTAINAFQCSNFIIEGVTIEDASAASIHCTGASYGLITGNRIIDSMADSIHIENYGGASHHIEVCYNNISGSGDDCVACVSYNEPTWTPILTQNHDLEFHHNSGWDQLVGRGFTVVGGRDVIIRDSWYKNNIGLKAGVYISSEPGFNSLGCDNILVDNIDIMEAGGDHGAVHLYFDNANNNNITINNVRTYNSGSAGVVVNGTVGTATNVHVTNSRFMGQWGGISLNNGRTIATNTNNVVTTTVNAYPPNPLA